MKYNFEKSKSKKNRRQKKIHGVFHSTFTNNETAKRFKDGGFIAWPEEKTSAAKNADVEIREGRTRNGGYIAFPK